MTNADIVDEANWVFTRTTGIVIGENESEPEDRNMLDNPGFSE